jgi:hypothetical protein
MRDKEETTANGFVSTGFRTKKQDNVCPLRPRGGKTRKKKQDKDQTTAATWGKDSKEDAATAKNGDLPPSSPETPTTLAPNEEDRTGAAVWKDSKEDAAAEKETAAKSLRDDLPGARLKTFGSARVQARAKSEGSLPARGENPLWQKWSEDSPVLIGKSCPQCHRANERCDLYRPCKRCMTHNLPCGSALKSPAEAKAMANNSPVCKIPAEAPRVHPAAALVSHEVVVTAATLPSFLPSFLHFLHFLPSFTSFPSFLPSFLPSLP